MYVHLASCVERARICLFQLVSLFELYRSRSDFTPCSKGAAESWILDFFWPHFLKNVTDLRNSAKFKGHKKNQKVIVCHTTITILSKQVYIFPS